MPRVKKEAAKEEKTTKKAPKAVAKKEIKEVKKTAPKKAEKTAVKAAPVKKAEVKEDKKAVAEKPVKAAKKTPKASKEDTGSVDFQIDNFSQKIKSLAKHLKSHTHDFDSRRGLLIMVGKRRRLLNYLKKSDPAKYEEAVKSLKLKS